LTAIISSRDAWHRDAAKYAFYCGESYVGKRQKPFKNLTFCSYGEIAAQASCGGIANLAGERVEP
jgi:hypothetical protein